VLGIQATDIIPFNLDLFTVSVSVLTPIFQQGPHLLLILFVLGDVRILIEIVKLGVQLLLLYFPFKLMLRSNLYIEFL